MAASNVSCISLQGSTPAVAAVLWMDVKEYFLCERWF